MEWGEARGRRQEEKGAVALLTLAALISGRRQWRMHFEGDNLTDARCYWPVALGHAHIALEKGASCQATGYPFNGYHLAFASNESLSAALFHISSANTLKREKERERREREIVNVQLITHKENQSNAIDTQIPYIQFWKIFIIPQLHPIVLKFAAYVDLVLLKMYVQAVHCDINMLFNNRKLLICSVG